MIIVENMATTRKDMNEMRTKWNTVEAAIARFRSGGQSELWETIKKTASEQMLLDSEGWS